MIKKMKKKLNLINLQKGKVKDTKMSTIRGGHTCGCMWDGDLLNRGQKKHDIHHPEQDSIASMSQD